MNETVQQSKRRWPWLVLGILVGLPILPALDTAIRRQRPKYVLTQDLDVSAAFIFRNGLDGPNEPPLRGTLLAGTEFTVVGQKGSVWYISLHTVVDGEQIATLSKLMEQ
jgi:hypothetical protein